MYTSVIIVRGILSELRRHGVAPEHSLGLLDLDTVFLADGANRLSLDEMESIVRTSVDVCGDPALGLSVATHSPPSSLQLLGHLLVSCRTLREAIGLLQRYAGLVAEGVTFSVVEAGDGARFAFRFSVSTGVGIRFAAEYIATMACRFASIFVGAAAAQPLRVAFEHARPHYHHRYAQVFGCPVAFAQGGNSISFASDVLDQRQVHADATIHAALRELAERDLSRSAPSTSIVEYMRYALRFRHSLIDVDMSELAHELGYSRSGLSKRLSREGSSFKQILDEARRAEACSELRLHRPVKDVAERLGFSETSAFHRAFKRWTGRTPSAFARSPNAQLGVRRDSQLDFESDETADSFTLQAKG